MEKLIQWPRAQYWDRPWNPMSGCQHCSPACDNCYARELFTTRFHKSFAPRETKQQHPPTRGVVFVGNATDLFGEWMDIPRIWSYFSKLWHFKKSGSPELNEATYLFCTKRVDKMCDALRNYAAMGNSYFGFTAENQEWYDKRMATVIDNATERANWWISAEPLLGPIDMHHLDHRVPFKWVAVGCESGPLRRPCPIEWVERVVEQCRNADVPVFVKQLDLNGRCERDIAKFPKHLQIRQVPWTARRTRGETQAEGALAT